MPSEDSSVIGIRASWTCALCRETEKTYQLLRVAESADELLRLPPGWRLWDRATVCRRHTVDECAPDGDLSGVWKTS